MKQIANTYELENRGDPISPDDIRKSLDDFSYFMANYAQIVGKDRHLHPFKLNPFQEMLFKELMPLIDKDTRLDRQLSVCILKPRQVGCSTGFIAFLNYICAYLNDFQNTSVCHVLPVADTISKLYTKKIEPIISGVHPDIFPTMERETLGSSIVTRYKDVKGVKRNNYYEVVSAGASSIRSDTLNIIAFDEVGFYRHPEVICDAAIGSMPDNGFSLVIYMSTFEDRHSDFFLDKIRTARDNPGDWKLIFAPWFIMYPERGLGLDYKGIELTKYDETVIIPAMIKYGVPESRWGDCIDWYHRKQLTISNIKKEFPTTIEEILAMGDDTHVFDKEWLDNQEKNILPGSPYRLITDNHTGKVEAQKVEDDSPLKIFRAPLLNHRYAVTIDPITAQNEDTDNFAMSVFDYDNNEQVAIFRGRNMPMEDYADYAVGMAKIYNRAMLIPEINVAEGFIAYVNEGHKYYNWYYENQAAKKKRTPGVRTTVSSKDRMIDVLKLLLQNKNIIIHDGVTLEELRNFVKRVKNKADGGVSVRMAARGKGHDDMVASLWIYAGTLNQQQITGKKNIGWTIL